MADSTRELVKSEVIFSYRRENGDPHWQFPFIVSPDGRFFFTIKGLVCYYIEIETSEIKWSAEKIFGDFPFCCFSDDGAKVIINDPIIILKTETGEEIFRLPKERTQFNSISSNGKFAVSLYHGAFTYWEVDSRKEIAVFSSSYLFDSGNDEVDEKISYSISLCPQGRYMFVRESKPNFGYNFDHKNLFYDLKNIGEGAFPEPVLLPEHLNGSIKLNQSSELLLASSIKNTGLSRGFDIFVSEFPSFSNPKQHMLVGCFGPYSFSGDGKWVVWIDGTADIFLRHIEIGKTMLLGKINSFMNSCSVIFSSDMLSLFVTTYGVPMITKNRYTERTTVKFIDVFVTRWDISEYTQPGKEKSATFPEVDGQTS